MIELLSNINFRWFAIKEARPKTGVAELFEQIRKANKAKDVVVQAFDYNSVINRAHLLGAYINTVMAFNSHSNKAKSPAMEMLLFAAMTDQIGTAIETIGARDTKLILFSNSRKNLDGMEYLLKDIGDFKPTAQHTRTALKKFGIKDAKNADALMLQKMAMSRLKL